MEFRLPVSHLCDDVTVGAFAPMSYVGQFVERASVGEDMMLHQGGGRKRPFLATSQMVTAPSSSSGSLVSQDTVTTKSSSSSSRRKRPRVSLPSRDEKPIKSVRFSSGPHLHSVIPCAVPVTQDDLKHSWLTRADYHALRVDCQALVMAFELGILDQMNDPNDACLRGLEPHLFSSMMDARKASRQNLIKVVMDAQEAQRDNRLEKNVETIRFLSTLMSKNACDDAVKMAAFDCEEVLEILREE